MLDATHFTRAGNVPYFYDADGRRVEGWPTAAEMGATVYEDDSRYRVVRFYRDAYPRRRTIARGMTLRAAQTHCHDAQTSSTTATTATARARTRRLGPWFDGYERED